MNPVDRPDLFLHIGYPKAASTYLQNILRRNFTAEAHRDGFLYSQNPPTIRNAINGRLATRIVFSDENYLIPPLEQLASDEMSRLGREEKIAAFRRHFVEHAGRFDTNAVSTRILIVYRDPEAFMPSLYKECVRYGRYRHKFDRFFGDWWDLFSHVLDLEAVERLVEDTHPGARITCIPFALLRKDRASWAAAVTTFFEGFTRTLPADRSRPSLSADATEQLRRMNGLILKLVIRAQKQYRLMKNPKVEAELQNFVSQYPRLLNLLTVSSDENYKLLNRVLRTSGDERLEFETTPSITQAYADFDRSIGARNRAFIAAHGQHAAAPGGGPALRVNSN